MTNHLHKTAPNALPDPRNPNCQTSPTPPPTTMSPPHLTPHPPTPYLDRSLEGDNLLFAFHMGLHSDPRWHRALHRYLTYPQPTNERKDNTP